MIRQLTAHPPLLTPTNPKVVGANSSCQRFEFGCGFSQFYWLTTIFQKRFSPIRKLPLKFHTPYLKKRLHETMWRKSMERARRFQDNLPEALPTPLLLTV